MTYIQLQPLVSKKEDEFSCTFPSVDSYIWSELGWVWNENEGVIDLRWDGHYGSLGPVVLGILLTLMSPSSSDPSVLHQNSWMWAVILKTTWPHPLSRGIVESCSAWLCCSLPGYWSLMLCNATGVMMTDAWLIFPWDLPPPYQILLGAGLEWPLPPSSIS